MAGTCPADCYSVEAPVCTEEETVELIWDLREISREYSRNADGDSDGMTEIMRSFANVYADSREQTERGCTLHLTAQVTLVGKDGEGAPMSLQLVEHFTMDSDARQIGVESFTAVPMAIISEGRAKVRLQGRMDAYAMTVAPYTYTGAVLPTEDALPSAGDSMTICYPAKGETLWEIAKRYRTTQSALLMANSLGEGELPAVLLIPRG